LSKDQVRTIMTVNFAVTPFGGAPMNAALFSLNQQLQERREALKNGAGGASNDGGDFDKWKLINALGVARSFFSLSDRTVAVLSALLSVLPGRTVTLNDEQIVFPSNAELSRRTNGMADATLRRHIAALIEAGLLLRRDSPNGKRYARRDDTGQIEAAFGFDLGPLAMRATEIFALEDDVKREEAQMRRLRDEISVHIRDVVKILDAAIVEQKPGDWQGFAMRLLPLGLRLRRGASISALSERRDALLRLRAEVEKTWLDSLNDEDMSGNDRDIERQLQNSNTESYIESSLENKLKRTVVPKTSERADERTEVGSLAREAPERKGGSAGNGRALGGGAEAVVGGDGQRDSLPALSMVLALCPQIIDYAKNGIASWRELKTTANLVRSMLGISPDAWGRAEIALGAERAAIVMAAMLERADKIRVPGGYLRAITAKAETGGFSVRPMLEALRAVAKG
jgi:replication initiation protein RepC